MYTRLFVTQPNSELLAQFLPSTREEISADLDGLARTLTMFKDTENKVFKSKATNLGIHLLYRAFQLSSLVCEFFSEFIDVDTYVYEYEGFFQALCIPKSHEVRVNYRDATPTSITPAPNEDSSSDSSDFSTACAIVGNQVGLCPSFESVELISSIDESPSSTIPPEGVDEADDFDPPIVEIYHHNDQIDDDGDSVTVFVKNAMTMDTCTNTYSCVIGNVGPSNSTANVTTEFADNSNSSNCASGLRARVQSDGIYSVQPRCDYLMLDLRQLHLFFLMKLFKREFPGPP